MSEVNRGREWKACCCLHGCPGLAWPFIQRGICVRMELLPLPGTAYTFACGCIELDVLIVDTFCVPDLVIK